MESNDDNIDSTEDSNSVSTDLKTETTQISREKVTKKNTNIVFVSPNELENWEIEEESKPKIAKKSSKQSKHNQNSSTSIAPTKISQKPKNPKSTPKSLRKKRGRPKRKKIQNPWSSDVEDENMGLENEISDDEYFRRLEEASEVYGSTTEVLEPMTVDSVDPQEEEDDDEEEIYIGQMKTFDLNNSDLLNYILNERENSLHINDPSKPQINLPQSSSDLKCPRDCVLQLLSIYETVIQYHKILRISPFKIEDFITAMITNENSVLLSEIHISILKLLLREDEIANTSLCPLDQKDGINLAFHLIDSMTWPELLRFYVKSIDYKSQKIHISDCYPFVTIYDRIGVLTFLLDLFVLGVSVRNEIARENVITHEDFCRVCHTSGEVLCCDTCSAVYHLDCLTPQLTSVPTTTWNCPICVRHKIPGLFDCNFDGEKALIEHKKTPLGQDRFGNTYWFIARRLIIEPRNDNIQNLVESILERDEEKDFEPVYDNVSYYSTFNSLELVRSQLNREWEAELCDVFDSLIEEMNKSMSVTVKLTKAGFEKFKKEISTDKEIVVILDEELKQFGRSIENNSENSSLILESIEQKNRHEPKFVLKTLSGQPVGVVEDQEGLLVRNVDGSTVRVRLSAKTRSNQLEEVAAMFNCEIDEENFLQYRLGDEGDWRFYENLYVSEFIALSKFQHQEDKDRKRILGNKYSLNECNEFQWYVSQPINRAGWFNCPSVVNRRPVNDILGGPLNMLQCLRLTLQNMESQMFSSFMCPAWKSERKNWLINIQRTRNAASLGDFVAIFESAIRGCCLKKSWTNSLGFLYLDRITAAEREEEKRIKNLERKTDRKPEGELVRTRNPGLLKHTIWKTKGEEYRRASGDGWSWLSVSIVYNPHKIRDFTENVLTKKAELTENNSQYLDLNDLIDISANVDNETLYPRKNILNNNNNSQLIDKLINVRLGELEAAKKEFDLEEAKRKLKELTNQRNEIRERKEQLEEKLGVLSKNYNRLVQYKTQHHNRKRLFPNYDQSFNNSGEKRMRYQNENSPFLSQYDGADDEDISSSKEVQTHIPVTIVSSNNDSPVVGNVNAKPIVINNTNNIRGLCVLNIGQNNNNQNQNRIMLNQPQQFKILRLGNNQIRLVTPTGNNPGTQQIRKFNVGGPQFVLVNNMSNIGQTSTVHSSSISNGHAINQSNVIYTPNNGMQVPIRIATPNNNQQQYKRLLPMEPAMMQQKQLPNIQNNPIPTNTQLYSNVMVGTSRMSTPVQGRRTISKVTHNTDNRIVSNTDSNDELVQRKEMDNLCNEILSLDQQLDQLDKHIAELENKIEQVTMDVSESYKLHKKSPIVDSVFKTDTEQDRQLPHRNPYKWPVDTKQFVRSVFLYKSDCLRPLILTAGRIEVPGFDVEKKRLNNIYWPYPTSRPNFSATWRYQVSRVCNSDDLDDRIFDLAATEPVVDPDHEKLKNVGSSGLSCLALCMKILWYSLRWEDMLTNWQGSNIATSITLSQGIFKETLATGETVERKIIGWKPLDKYCSQCSYLVTICTTTTTVDSPSSTRSRGRTNRRGRQRASARYTDIDYFTDDGEIDSEDSDPNFIPGVSRAGRPRGRRPRNRINDDFQAIKLPEKKFKEEWMDEDMLELWEIRDYLMSISWRRFVFAQTKNQSQLVSSIMNKREFQRIDNSTQSSQILSHRNVLTSSIIPNTVTHNTVTPIAISTVNNENIIRSVTTPLNIIAKTETSTEKPFQLSDPKTIEEPVSVKPEINLINSEKSVETKILTKPENLPSKLIIESASTTVKTLSTLGDNSGGIIGTPNNIIKTLPVPITDIREISRSEPHPTRARSLRSRGRGRGRGRPPMQRSISSQSEDTKFDDVVLDMDSTMSAISDRINSTKQNVIDIEVIKALNKADDLHFSELAKKESKKIKKHRKEQYKDSSEELTDREVETGSTSPAIDSQICEDPEPKTPIPITNRSTNHNKRSFSKRRNRSKHTKDSSDDSEGSDSDRQTIGQRSESNDQNSNQDPPKKRSRKHSSDYSTSPKRSNKSKSKKVEAEEETQEKELYCICKTYDPTQKYIGCDYCERWFHFSCVQMTGKKVSSIDMWKCQICQQKENDQIYCKCQTKYDPSKLYIGCDYCDEWYHPQCIGMTDSEANNYQGNYMCPSCKQSKKKKKKSEESSTSNSNIIDYEKKVNPDIRRKLSELLNKMMKHKSAIYFLKPVDVKVCPGYYQVVRSPMDLSTAKTNLDKMKYSTIGSFKLDMHKIFTACRIYFDESSKEYQSADKLEDYFLTELREIY